MELLKTIDEVVTELHKKGVFEMEIQATNSMGEPTAATINVVSEGQL